MIIPLNVDLFNNCCVPGCTMTHEIEGGSLHKWPNDKKRSMVWAIKLRMGKAVPKYAKVCSLHFTPADYKKTIYDGKKK